MILPSSGEVIHGRNNLEEQIILSDLGFLPPPPGAGSPEGGGGLHWVGRAEGQEKVWTASELWVCVQGSECILSKEKLWLWITIS